MKTEKTTPPDLQRLVLLLEDVERHLLSVYGETVADFESDPIQDEGWSLYCEIKKERERLLKFREFVNNINYKQ